MRRGRATGSSASDRTLESGCKSGILQEMTVEQIEREALGLPSEARARLADCLVESLNSAEMNHIDEVWIAEARRRRDEVRQGKVQTIPGPEALAHVRRTVGG